VRARNWFCRLATTPRALFCFFIFEYSWYGDAFDSEQADGPLSARAFYCVNAVFLSLSLCSPSRFCWRCLGLPHAFRLRWVQHWAKLCPPPAALYRGEHLGFRSLFLPEMAIKTCVLSHATPLVLVSCETSLRRRPDSDRSVKVKYLMC
jgi:hypothetical protein